MRWEEGVHESLKIRPPPLCQCVANHPFIIDCLACELVTNRSQALIQPSLEALDFILLRLKVVTGPSEPLGISTPVELPTHMKKDDGDVV